MTTTYRPLVSEIRCVTLSVSDLGQSLTLYRDGLGMEEVQRWQVTPQEVALLGGRDEAGDCILLQQPDTPTGTIRLVRFESPGTPINEGARPWDHGLIKNLDFFAHDVASLHREMTDAGLAFLAPPVTYPVPWGDGVLSTEAHLSTTDGVKIALAALSGSPRTSFGLSPKHAKATEVATATQVVANFDAAERFYARALDCVPAAPLLVDDEALAASLRLPPGTRLRLAFIGPPEAVGGKVGLVAYEGSGVGNARDLSARVRPPHLGALGMSFQVGTLESACGRVLANGGQLEQRALLHRHPARGLELAASMRSPEGQLLEFFESLAREPEYLDLLESNDLQEGAVVRARAPGIGTFALTRTDGLVAGLEERCPHLGAPLSGGRLQNGHVVCPWHGWCVNAIDGSVRGAPGIYAKTLPISEENGRVRLRIRTEG